MAFQSIRYTSKYRQLSHGLWLLAVFASTLIYHSPGKANEQNDAEPVHLVATIHPLAGISADICGSLCQIDVLVGANDDHHHIRLQPSQIRKLHDADIIVWIGEIFEQPLSKLIHQQHAVALGFSQLLPQPAPATHIDHDQDDHPIDPHLWLSTDTVAILARALSAELQRLRPEQKDYLEQRLEAFLASLQRTHQRLSAQLQPYQNLPYVLQHPAFSLFEAEFGLHQGMVLSHSEHHDMSLGKLADIEAQLQHSGARCMIINPLTPNAMLDKISRKHALRQIAIDPTGQNIDFENGYFMAFMQSVADGFEACLRE